MLCFKGQVHSTNLLRNYFVYSVGIYITSFLKVKSRVCSWILKQVDFHLQYALVTLTVEAGPKSHFQFVFNCFMRKIPARLKQCWHTVSPKLLLFSTGFIRECYLWMTFELWMLVSFPFSFQRSRSILFS